MKYTVEIGSRTVDVEIENGSVLVDGRPVEAQLVGYEGGAIRRLQRGRQGRTLVATQGDDRGAWTVLLEGTRLSAQVLTKRDLALRAAVKQSGSGGGSGELKAPMPGLVVRVLVKAGDQVASGQGLVVLEAMKMENELKAPGPGTVTSVNVAAGARVMKGAVLLLVS